jgi:hypothetical protein
MTAAKTKRVGAKRNWPWSKRTYSAKRKTWTRPKGSGKKLVSYRVHSPAVKPRVKAPRIKAAARARTKAPVTKATGTKMPALFGMPYERLSPSQQALVRKAVAHNRANPGKSFERCVEAVSKRKGVKSPAAVCAASKMRTARGKRELLASARRGKLAAHSSRNPFRTLTQGQQRADIFQTGDHEFSVAVGSDRRSFKSFRAAESWARLRLHEVSNPQGVRVKLYPVTQRKNPLDRAQQVFEEFHGFPSTEVLEYVEQVHFHSALAGIGPLISMTVQHGTKEALLAAPDPANAKIGDVVQLTATEDGRQFVLVGGDQQIPLEALMGKFGLTKHDVRDHMVIGQITRITYRTRKSFESNGQEEIDFYHDLGGEHSDGVLPTLIYKPRNPSMEIAGGRYFIGKPDKSLGGVSPGIVG